MERYYSYKISPEVIKSDITIRPITIGTIAEPIAEDPCCQIPTTAITTPIIGYSTRRLPMSEVVTGGTNGNSIMTGLTLPILLTQNNIDIGYYSVFDGAIQQKDSFTNFIFSGSNINQYEIFVSNTSNSDLYKFLSFTDYSLDWGDGTIEIINNTSPFIYSHIYPATPATYTISLSGVSPWNYNFVTKTITLPYSAATNPNPNGTAYFIPLGGSWSGTPFSYNYLFSGDSICDTEAQSSYNFTNVPFLITGFTYSRLNDLRVYGKESELLGGKYKPYEEVNGSSGIVGYVSGYGQNYVSYVISGITYIDYFNGNINSPIPLFTIFFAESSGITSDSIVCSALTKNEALLNVINETEIQSNVFVDRGQLSPLESVMRLGEVDNVGDLIKYGYRFFNIINT